MGRVLLGKLNASLARKREGFYKGRLGASYHCRGFQELAKHAIDARENLASLGHIYKSSAQSEIILALVLLKNNTVKRSFVKIQSNYHKKNLQAKWFNCKNGQG